MIRPILRMGDPRLLRTARELADFGWHFDSPELRALVADMEETMLAAEGVGLAAPQIGVDLRLVIFGFDSNARYPDEEGVPYTVLINPQVQPLGADDPEQQVEGWEGCLSVPGLRGLVPRWPRIRYRGFDLAGQPIDRVVEGFHARVVQHECDHLDGTLYPMRMRDLAHFGFSDALPTD